MVDVELDYKIDLAIRYVESPEDAAPLQLSAGRRSKFNNTQVIYSD